jgi:hypothetical protein
VRDKLQPPTGYTSWLDYAVETFDTRSHYIEALFDDSRPDVDREAIREAARQELRELLECANERGVRENVRENGRDRLKSELAQAFAAPDSDAKTLTAEELLARNRS